MTTRSLSQRFGMNILSGLSSFLPFLILLYTIALSTSMSGMEILSWSICFFVILIAVFNKIFKADFFKAHTLGIEVPLFGLLIVVAVGLKLNAPDADFLFNFGSIRNLLLIFFLCYAFQISGNLNRMFLVFTIAATLVAAYGIYQHFTGVDVWRHFMGKESPITNLPSDDKARWMVIGFFGHHLTFANCFAMIVPIPWAAFLLSRRQEGPVKKVLFALSFLILFTAVILTFGRGIWIALALTLPIMGWFVSRKLFFVIVLILGTAFGVGYKFDASFHQRVDNITDTSYFSNQQRKDLWAANKEMFFDHPALGVGYLQNEQLATAYFKKLQIENGMAGHAHSNYLQFLSTTGLVGTGFYLLIVLTMLFMTMRLYSSIPSTHYWHRVFVLAALGAQLAFHFGGITQWNFGDAEVNHGLMFWWAVVCYMNEKYLTSIVPDDHAL